MALEAVVFPKDLLGCTIGGVPWGYGNNSNGLKEEEDQVEKRVFDGMPGSWGTSCSSILHGLEEWDVNSSGDGSVGGEGVVAGQEAAAACGRRKRRRTKSIKNKEEVENQRMTHIAVERNRRKQMNEYLAVLRSLMPVSYVQRGDQASIIGGAINFVKELEQLLQSLEAQKRTKQSSDTAPFAGFFAFPQYSRSTGTAATSSLPNSDGDAAENRAAMADIEVTMVESHASLKVFARRRPKQLLKMLVGLQNLRLSTMHLNVTTVDQMVLYSLSLKVEDDCQLSSVDDIATAVNQMLGKIEEESGCS
ncbi:transcription factor bHLH94-like [Typha angustifolia]|uniref:transcription factor bHLH94-like n=1 Tax=Typha angustifolia TaxID=59011 RepID=UPI003C2C5B5F